MANSPTPTFSHDAPEPHVRHSVGRNLAAMASSQLLTWVLGTAAMLAYPRFLGPEGVGQLQLAFSLWLIAQVCVNLGTGTHLVLQMSRDPERGASLVGPILLIRLAAFGIASACMAGYLAIGGFSTEMVALVAIAGLAMLATILQETFGAAFSGLERMTYNSVATVVSKLLFTVAVLIVLFAGGGVLEVAWTTVIGGVVGLGLAAFFYRRHAPITFGRPAEGYVGVVRNSVSFMVGSVILVVYQQIDIVVMSRLVSDATLGWYASADSLIHSLLFIPAMLLGVLFPVMGRLQTTDTAAAERVVNRAFSVLVITGVAVGYGAAAIGEPFAVLLFGEDFREGGHVLSVFALSLPLIFLTMLFGQVAYTTGRQVFWSKIMAVGVVASVAFDLVFVPIFDRSVGNGGIAGALGYIVTEFFMVLVAMRRVAPQLFTYETAAQVSKVIVAGGAMFVAASLLRNQILIVPIAVGAFVFLALVVLFRIPTADDRELFRTLLDRLPIPRRRRSIDAFDQGGHADPPIHADDAGDDVTD